MYCVNCGVKLADTEAVCPLCNTAVYHPDIKQPACDPTYPKNRFPKKPSRSFALQIVLTGLFLLPMTTAVLCDFQFNHTILWSDYVVGGLLACYITLILPTWFRKPNPTIFTPCAFAAILAYVWYIAVSTGGQWFYTLALPVIGGFALVFSAVVTLLYYLKRGHYYVLGGALLTLGAFIPVVEFLINITFSMDRFIGWSLYPLITMAIFGSILIILGIYRPAREVIERQFFI